MVSRFVQSLGVFGVISAVFLSAGCSDAKKDTPAASTTPVAYTYADTKVIIDTKCASCHAKHASYGTLAGIKAGIPSKLKDRITATGTGAGLSYMPQADTTGAFQSTAEGKILIEWLTNGADLK